MEPKFQTSFIPKKPIVTASPSVSFSRTESEGGFFSLLSKSLFVLTIIVAGGLFGYKYLLNSQIDTANKDLAAAREAFQPDTIQSLITASARIAATKRLLDNHVTVSQLFSLLQSLTVKHVRLSNFSYANKNNMLTVTADVEAQNYGALSQQSDIFQKNSYLLNPSFSNFDLADNGNITAKFETNIDPTLVSYKKAIGAISGDTEIAASTTPSTQP